MCACVCVCTQVCKGRLVHECAHSTVAMLKQLSQNRNSLPLSQTSVLSRLVWGQGALDATCLPPLQCSPSPGQREQQAGHFGTHWCGLCLVPWSSFPTSDPKRPRTNSPISCPPGSISSLELAICRKLFQQPGEQQPGAVTAAA